MREIYERENVKGNVLRLSPRHQRAPVVNEMRKSLRHSAQGGLLRRNPGQNVPLDIPPQTYCSPADTQ